MEDIRKFALVVLDKTDRIIDRYDFDVVTNISGLGYKLKLSTIDTDIENYVTKIVQEKKQLSMTIIHKTGYSSANFFDTWCEKHINDVVCLEYYDTTKTLYIEGKVLETTKTEKNEFGVLEQQFVFQPLTPFFEKIDNDVKIQVAAVGKKYPFKYAYNYGLNQIENNSIKNTYIKDIPINVTIYGAISNPIITLLDENGNVYNEVRFVNVDLTAGQKLIINSAQKKIWFDNGTGNLVDYYYKLDGAYDSYLRAKPLATSSLNINLTSSDTGRLIGSRRQYRL